MNLKLLPPLVAIALLWGGSQSVYTSLKNSAPEETTCGRVLVQPPDAEWLSLSDCEYDLEHLAHAGLLGTVSELYIPLRPKGDESSVSRIVLFTEDKPLLEVVRALEATSDPTALATHAERLAEVRAPDRITGVVKFGIELKTDDVDKLRAVNPHLPKDFLLLEHGARPMPAALSFSLLGAGIVLSVWLVWRVLRSRGGEQAVSGSNAVLPRLRRTLEDVDSNVDDSTPQHPEVSSGGFGEVQDSPSLAEGASIVDTHVDHVSRVLASHTQHSAKGE